MMLYLYDLFLPHFCSIYYTLKMPVLTLTIMIGVDPAILRFAEFCTRTIAMQSRLQDGIPLSEATTDRALKDLVKAKKLRNLIRSKTPEHLYVPHDAYHQKRWGWGVEISYLTQW